MTGATGRAGEAAARDGRIRAPLLLGGLAALVLGLSLLSLATGAVPLPVGRVAALLLTSRDAADPATARDLVIVTDIRLPRTLVGLLVGAALATSGAILQGLFRNPLADPALLGVSSGSAVAAACVIVLGHRFTAAAGPIPFAILPVAAFVGALGATSLLYAIGTRRGRTSVATMLLAGVALAALAGAATGLLAFASDDRQLRDLSFWTLGSLGGASWTRLAVVAPPILAVVLLAPLLARALNAFLLGEADAFHLGVPVERVKRLAILGVAVAVGSAVAVAGLVGFVGLVVPHALRLAIGPDHRRLLPASALLGGALLLAADMAARVVAAPAELPIGIVTALIGAPYFLWLLLRGGAADA